MLQRVTVALALLLFLKAVALAQGDDKVLKVGDSAPPIQAARLLTGNSAAIDTGSLAGKVVVIEFWATWCIPCIEAIPHLNALIEKLAGRPFVFLSVTDEEEDLVRKFLEKRTIKGSVVLNPDRSLFDAFKTVGIPHLVVIGRDGRVAAVTAPKDLTLEALERIAAGQAAGIPMKDLPGADLTWDQEIDWRDGVRPMTQVLIKPIRTSTGGLIYEPGSNRYAADGFPLKALIQTAFEVNSNYLDYRLPQSEQQYRVSVIVPEEQKGSLLPMLQEALLTTFGFRVRWEEQDRDVYVLKRAEGATIIAPSKAEKEFSSFMGRTAVGQKLPLAQLTEVLTNFLRRPVVDETGLDGRYDWKLTHDRGNPQVLINQVRVDLGLELEPARRKVKIFIVEPRK